MNRRFWEFMARLAARAHQEARLDASRFSLATVFSIRAASGDKNAMLDFVYVLSPYWLCRIIRSIHEIIGLRPDEGEQT